MKDFFSLQVVVGVTTTVIQEWAVVPEIVGLEVLIDSFFHPDVCFPLIIGHISMIII